MEFSKKDIILNSWKAFKEHVGLWMLIMLFIFCLNLFISTVQEKLLDNITTQTILFIIAAFLFQSGLNLGMLKLAMSIHENKEAKFKHIFGSFHILTSYVFASFIYLFLIFIIALPGIIILFIFASIDFNSGLNLDTLGETSIIVSLLIIIIPLTYTSIRLQFYDYFLVNEECSALDSIKRSINITKGYTGELFILGLILSIIIL